MQTITRSYPGFPFKPLHGESTDPAELAARGSFFSATLEDTIIYAEALPTPLLVQEEGRFVTWFRSLQTLPPHANVLPYDDKLVACPVSTPTEAATYFLISPGAAAATTANGLLVGHVMSLPAYLDELKERLEPGATLTIPENTIRTIAMDILCGLYHLHLHGLTHRHVCPSAIRVNSATAGAKLGDLACSLDTFSGACALNLHDGEVVADIKGLGHIVLVLVTGDATLAPPPPETPAGELVKYVDTLVSSAGKKYTADLAAFALACLSCGAAKADLDALFQDRFLLPMVVADVHRSRVPQGAKTAAPAAAVPAAAASGNSSLPVPVFSPQRRDSQDPLQSPKMSLGHSSIGTPILTDALPRTTSGLGVPFTPGSLNSRTRLVPTRQTTGEVHVMTCGATLPKREQYFYMDGKDRRYLAGYGLVFEIDVRRPISLEDIFFTTVGDVRSMHVQLYWKSGDVLRGSDRASGEWVPVLRRPKHLRKVMAHKPQSVGPFNLHLPFVDSLADANRNRHSFLLVTNYAHGVRFYGLPHGLLGQAVGAPLDTDGNLTITTGVPCGEEVCTAAAGAMQPQQKPDSVDGDESDDAEDEVEDPRSPSKAEAFAEASARAAVSAALDKALAVELAKPHDCPRGLFGGLKYTAIA